MGADIVINHKNNIKDELQKHELVGKIDYIFSCFDMSLYGEEVFADIIRPYDGKICSIVEHSKLFNIGHDAFKSKAITFSWEFMFSKGIFNVRKKTQSDILNNISTLIDNGTLKHIMKKNLGKITPDSLNKAHERLKNGSVIGKLCFEGL